VPSSVSEWWGGAGRGGVVGRLRPFELHPRTIRSLLCACAQRHGCSLHAVRVVTCVLLWPQCAIWSIVANCSTPAMDQHNHLNSAQ
jgi:hypothetical protein